MLYTVVAYRWGFTNNESPSGAAGVTTDREKACALAEEIADNGAGKHGVAVYEWSDMTARTLIKYISSTYGEPEPFDNPRIEMFSAIGHAAHAAATIGTILEAASDGEAEMVRPALVPTWLHEVIRRKMQDSEFSLALLNHNRTLKEQGQPPVKFNDTAIDALWEAAGVQVKAELAKAPQVHRDLAASRSARFGASAPYTREALLTLDYLPLEKLLALVDSPAREVCQRVLADNRALFEKAPGSRHNHQAWEGGYLDHVVDGMNYARHMYAFDSALGRPMPFSLSDALLIFFLHDLEKPWRILAREDGTLTNADGFADKAAFKAFRERKLVEAGLELTPAQRNALTYVEGEGDAYSSAERVMNELAAFCHKVDIWSARQCHDYPKASGDEWTGAGRHRVTAA